MWESETVHSFHGHRITVDRDLTGGERVYCPAFRYNGCRPMVFIHEDFLLSNRTARHLYHTYAEPEPILDYHCHLPPKAVAETTRLEI